MDFRQLNSNPANKQEPVPVAQPQHPVAKRGVGTAVPKWLNLMSVAVLFGVAVLLLLLSVLFARGNTNDNEFKYVSSTQYQAVFLNNGQVYFGNVKALNGKYIDLVNVHYLTQNATTNASGQQQASGDYTLVKLGCQQIHSPTDRMLINRDQVTFWENIKGDGKVAKSIEEFKKQNPKGPNCDEQTSQTPAENAPSQASKNSTTTQNSQTTTNPR
ncbi:hypothetical protein IPL68_02340 [Candidatus Saccharibacteria bacterium]|nr:MAG: hypothetical protein IPL68_02340 [Candidatus Saccharibacteria bacterium]